MTGDLKLINDDQSVMPIGVALPNVKETITSKKENLNLSEISSSTVFYMLLICGVI